MGQADPRRQYQAVAASYRQRITHCAEQLDFLSEDDKDWIMGRAILARLGGLAAARCFKPASDA